MTENEWMRLKCRECGKIFECKNVKAGVCIGSEGCYCEKCTETACQKGETPFSRYGCIYRKVKVRVILI